MLKISMEHVGYILHEHLRTVTVFDKDYFDFCCESIILPRELFPDFLGDDLSIRRHLL